MKRKFNMNAKYAVHITSQETCKNGYHKKVNELKGGYMMNLSNGKYYWPTTLKKRLSFPLLEEDLQCDVLIIGAGGSGAQLAYYLSEQNLDVVVVDKAQPGSGSTAVNTALIQYAGDKMFFELANSFGEEIAARHLKLCENAITELEEAAAKLPIDADFVRRDSLYYASQSEDMEKLSKEFALLKKHGFNVEWLNDQKIAQHFPFKKEAAILYKNDAELNPLNFTHGLLDYSKAKGVRIYADTEISGHKIEKNQTQFFTKRGNTIKANKVVIAAGYESLDFKKEKMQ